MDTFEIDSNYIVNNNPNHYNDLGLEDQCQKEVYIFAQEIMQKYNLKSIIDVGCGNAFKLIKYLSNYSTIGVECEPCFAFLRQKYPDRKWVLSGEPEKSFVEEKFNTDLVICSDVIEHIVNPDDLVNFLLSIDTKYYIISTPCRFLLNNHPKFKESRASNVNGPPVNDCHVREWTMSEFHKYLSRHFKVLEFRYGLEQIECQYFLLTKI